MTGTDQKHLLLFVPDYDESGGASGRTGAPLTYLQLGAADARTHVLTTARERGDDLLAAAGLEPGTTAFFVDDTRASQTDAGTQYFRYAAKIADGASPPTKSRADLTSELMGARTVRARGGWRDHTDGNRIVTVRGDRVDVVMGNYRRVVLGRVVKPEKAAPGNEEEEPLRTSFWEMAGGHIFDATSTGLAELTSIAWVEEEVDGQTYWKITEQTHKGDHIVRYSGRLEEYFNGPKKTETIGSEKGSAEDNPTITKTHYLEQLTANVAADSFHATTTAGTLSVGNSVQGSLVEHRRSLFGYESVGMSGSHTMASFKQSLWTKDALKLEIFAVRGELGIGGTKVSKSGNAVNITAGASLEIDAGGGKFQLHLGPWQSLGIGGKTSVKLGSSREWLAAAALDLKLGWVVRVPLKKTRVVDEHEHNHASKWHTEATKIELGGLLRKVFLFSNRT